MSYFSGLFYAIWKFIYLIDSLDILKEANILFLVRIYDTDFLVQAGAMLGDAFLHQLPHAFGKIRSS